jgi:oxalate decarboxylase/phosphoglucose isomerase-like protein (cupin superfamily)
MLNKLKSALNIGNSSKLFESLNPLEFSKNTSYDSKEYFTAKNLKNQSLDPQDSKDIIYTLYHDISKKSDSLLFESSEIKVDLFIIHPKKLGREFAKTLRLTNLMKDESKETVFEVISGSGKIIVEDIMGEEIRLIKVEKGSLVVIARNHSFVIINDSETNLSILSLSARESEFIDSFKDQKAGAALYYTSKGFLRNKNNSPVFNLEEVEDDYLLQYSFDKEKGLYKEFTDFPEKFNFLN